jgi:hypothetical protein
LNVSTSLALESLFSYNQNISLVVFHVSLQISPLYLTSRSAVGAVT